MKEIPLPAALALIFLAVVLSVAFTLSVMQQYTVQPQGKEQSAPSGEVSLTFIKPEKKIENEDAQLTLTIV